MRPSTNGDATEARAKIWVLLDGIVRLSLPVTLYVVKSL
jgi:hypothetical protein